MKRLALVFAVFTVMLYSGAVGAPGAFYHPIKQGETVGSIARKYDLPIREIAKANKLKSPYTIYEGETLLIPVSTELRGTSFRRAGTPWRWRKAGKHKFAGGCEKGGKDPKNVRKSLESQLGDKSQFRGKFKKLIPIFERRIREGDYVLLDIQNGEYFNSMSFTKDGKMLTVIDLVADLDAAYMKENNIPYAAERYIEHFEGFEVKLTNPRACCNYAITVTPLPPPPRIPPPKPPETGIVEVHKEAIDISKNRMLPPPQVTVILDGDMATAQTTDKNGVAIFKNVIPGFHKVTEVETGEVWDVFVTPETVEVKPGETSIVWIKNIQVLPPEKPPAPPEERSPPPPPEEPEKPKEPEEPLEPIQPLEPEPEVRYEMDRRQLESEFNGVGGGWGYSGGKLGDLDLEGWYYSLDETVWYHPCEKCPWKWGLGFIGGFDNWEAEFGKGRGYRIGPQVGGKFFESYGKNKYHLGEFKIRPFTYEVQRFRGDNGNKSDQRSLVPELRLSYEMGEPRYNMSLKPERFGIFLNLRVPFNRDINSNFGARETGISTAMFGAWAQWQLAQFTPESELSLRATLAPFYQQWDEQTGIHTGVGVRYEGWPFDITVGPFVNWFPFRPDSGRMIGLGGQVEFRNYMQFAYRKVSQRSLVPTSKLRDPQDMLENKVSNNEGHDDTEKVTFEDTGEEPKIQTLEHDTQEGQTIQRLSLTESSWPEDPESQETQEDTETGNNSDRLGNGAYQDFDPSLLK